MLMEGTFKYFLMLFLVFTVVYITVKVCIGKLLKRAKEKPYKAYIPIYTTYFLTDLLDLKKSVFWLSLIPFVGLFYLNVIIKKLLEAFGQDSKESILYILFPMYKFPELVFKKPKFILNEYDLTEEFLETQKMLFEKPAEELPDKINLINPTVDGMVIAPESYNQDNISMDSNVQDYQAGNFNQVGNVPDYNSGNNVQNFNQGLNNYQGESYNQDNVSVENNVQNYQAGNFNHDLNDNQFGSYNQMGNAQDYHAGEFNNIQDFNQVSNGSNLAKNDSVFTNQNLEPDKRHETYFEAKPEVKEEKPIVTKVDEGRPKMCPNCGARLSAGATVCFLCGHKL